MNQFPKTRYMGSKFRLLPFIHSVLKEISFHTALDAFSGSGAVAYLLKGMGKVVTANDHLAFCFHNAHAGVANSRWRITEDQLDHLLRRKRNARHFIERTFRGLYYSDEDNRFLDNVVAGIAELPNRYLRSLAFAAACRACVKRRPRGVFTYTGQRYDDGRRDLTLSLRQHFREAIQAWNAAVFDNGSACKAHCADVYEVPGEYDLVYIDPPYFSPRSDNEYLRRYHFLEGLVRYWQGVTIQQHTSTKKFRSPATPFRRWAQVNDAFDRLFSRFADSVIVVSYSSNGLPGRGELKALLRKYKRRVEVFSTSHAYSFGTHSHKLGNSANRVEEFLFVGY